MNKKIFIAVLVIILIAIIGITIYLVIGKSIIKEPAPDVIPENVISNSNETQNDVKYNNDNEVDDTMEDVMNIKVSINNEEYIATIEKNETAQTFINQLPQEFIMNELNGNEKYVYMDNSLPTNPLNPEHIQCGDIMLYNNNCLVIFYKSFNTNYSYTKIGHIDNFPNLEESDSITARFEK